MYQDRDSERLSILHFIGLHCSRDLSNIAETFFSFFTFLSVLSVFATE
jgi:hypothetical protein